MARLACKPAKLDTVTFVQGGPVWSQATGVRLETADGSTMDLTLVAGTRDPQCSRSHSSGRLRSSTFA